jgi:hypothetical protein
MQETDLKIYQMGMAPWSARGCKQQLRPIHTADLRRTVNGELINLVASTHHKYKTIISCSDRSGAALDGFWKGKNVTIECIQTLTQKFEGNVVTLSRSPVMESVVVIGQDQRMIRAQEIEDNNIHLADVHEGFVIYRPILEMRITKIEFETDEWDMVCKWTLEAEEA